MVSDEYYKETKQRITLVHSTLSNLTKGGRPRSQANFEEKSWITKEETEAIIAYTLEIAEWGHPLSQRRLKEHVDHILRARLGPKFPKDGVSINWVHHFMEKHSSCLHIYTAKALDTARGQAVNEEANT